MEQQQYLGGGKGFFCEAFFLMVAWILASWLLMRKKTIGHESGNIGK